MTTDHKNVSQIQAAKATNLEHNQSENTIIRDARITTNLTTTKNPKSSCGVVNVRPILKRWESMIPKSQQSRVTMRPNANGYLGDRIREKGRENRIRMRIMLRNHGTRRKTKTARGSPREKENRIRIKEKGRKAPDKPKRSSMLPT